MIKHPHRLFILIILISAVFPTACLASKIASGDFKEIQARVDILEKKAIDKKQFTNDDKAFLKDLYSSLAFGGRMIGHREAADMLDRYLAATGESLWFGSEAYEANPKVKAAMEKPKSRIRADYSRGALREKYATERIFVSVSEDARLFYFSDVFFLQARPEKTADNRLRIIFRVDLTAHFISYDEEKARYGGCGRVCTPFAKNGKGETFAIDDGLSQYLTVLGLAKEFGYYSEWTREL